jgi:hypothetical protein
MFPGRVATQSSSSVEAISMRSPHLGRRSRSNDRAGDKSNEDKDPGPRNGCGSGDGAGGQGSASLAGPHVDASIAWNRGSVKDGLPGAKTSRKSGAVFRGTSRFTTDPRFTPPRSWA